MCLCRYLKLHSIPEAWHFYYITLDNFFFLLEIFFLSYVVLRKIVGGSDIFFRVEINILIFLPSGFVTGTRFFHIL